MDEAEIKISLRTGTTPNKTPLMSHAVCGKVRGELNGGWELGGLFCSNCQKRHFSLTQYQSETIKLKHL